MVVKVPTFAILLIVIVGGVSVGGVFASHDAGIEHLGSFNVNSDGVHNTAQLLINSGVSSQTNAVVLEAKGQPGVQSTFLSVFYQHLSS